ncbi:MAG: cytochrome c [Alphaproteobacteria bacterium]|nr:cytochrome c [Alphaproteobacteria bacterium]
MVKLLLGVVASVAVATSAFAQSAAVKRGDYLANGVMTCANCHTPKGPPAAVAGKDYSGGLSWDTPTFAVTAPNITSEKETGIGGWTAAQIKKALIDGVRPNGVPLAPIMPSGFYAILTPSDADALVAYMQSLKPVKNKVKDPVYKAQMSMHRWPGTEKPATAADLRDKVKLGHYMVAIGHCMECHTPMVKGQPQLDKVGTGGRKFPGPWGESESRNITSHKEKGIGGWTDAQIKTAITQGKRPDGTALKGPMGYQYYATMTNEDLDAVVAYLRTVPAKE